MNERYAFHLRSASQGVIVLSGATGSVRNVVAGVATLSFGTVLVQASALISQFVFAIWLTPADFGYWAAGLSLMSVMNGLINFGEVNGYLSNRSYSYRRARNATWKANSLLLAAGLVVGVVVYRNGDFHTAISVFILAALLPVVGYGNLLIAVSLRASSASRVVRAQAWAAICRIAFGTVAAWLFGTVVAFGIAMAAYSLALALYLRFRVSKEISREVFREENTGEYTPLDQPTVTGKSKLRWAIYSVAQYMPGQIDYLVLAVVSTPALLGVYYMAFQITVGISLLVSGSLSKAALAALSGLNDAQQSRIYFSLSKLTVGMTSMGAALCAAACLAAGGLVPAPWEQVPAIAAILLASLPARLMSPLTDARLMASGRWGKGTIFSVVDTIGTGLAALTILSGSVLLMSFAIVGWKLLFGTARSWIVIRDSNWSKFKFVASLGVATCLIASAQLMGAVLQYFCLLGAAVLGAAVALDGRRVRDIKRNLVAFRS